MIQDIFLPEKIGEYYLFSQKILGIDINKSHINAALLTASGSHITITKTIQQELAAQGANHQEKVIAALPEVIKQIGKVDQIRTAIPSNLVVFKEINLPFTSRKKIEMVVRFEVEPLLPFPGSQAIIDFIITGENKETGSSQVLVAAVQRQHVEQHLALFEQAGIDPTAITVDMFALYGLYREIPDYNNATEGTVLLDLDMQSTRILVIENNELRIVRNLPYGIGTIAKEAGSDSNLKPAQALEQLIRFGLQGAENRKLVSQVATYFDKVKFALNSTTSLLKSKTISKIILLGAGSQIKELNTFAQDILGINCELFDSSLLLKNKRYRLAKAATLSESTTLSLAIATLSTATQDFNLEKDDLAPVNSSLLLKQSIVAMTLLICLFGTLFTHIYLQSYRLKSEIEMSQEEAIEELRERFPNIPEEDFLLDEVVDGARKELTQEEKIWMAFSSQARASFLEYLLELTNRISKSDLGFDPEELTIKDGAVGEITLKAKVRDFDALTQLEQALRQSKLFSYVEGQTTPDFTMKIMIARKG